MSTRWLITVLAALVFAVPTHAASIQARLIRATNKADDSPPVDAALKDIAPKLKKRFGFESYRLMGTQQQSLDKESTSRLNLGEGFVVFIKPKSVEKTAHELDVQWWSGRALLVKTTVKISEKSSLLIKGPEVGDDWIILALTMQE